MPWCPQCGVEYREGFTECSDCRVGLVNQPLSDEAAGPPEWVTVSVYNNLEAAELAQGFLQSEGIEVELASVETHALPTGTGLLGEVFLRVPPAQVERATALLAEADTGAEALAEGETEPTPETGSGDQT
jgi:hypothetical protein